MSTLLLNADFTPIEVSPLSTMSWQESMRAYFTDKFQVVKMYDNWKVHTVNDTWEVPSIISISDYQKQPEYAKLSRKNIFIRDSYKCQYCNIQFLTHELTFDHVVPRRDGGRTTWENIATACQHCNTKKGSRRDVHPVRKPYRPTFREIYNQGKCYKITIPDPDWQQFLKWPEELLEVQSPHKQ